MTPPDPADPVVVASDVVPVGEEDSAPSVAEPEYQSIEAFAEYLADDDRTTYRPADIIRLMKTTKLSREEISAALATYGYQPRAR